VKPWEKIHLCLSLLIFSVLLVLSHAFGSLYPYLPIFKGFIALSLIPFIWSDKIRVKYFLIICIFSGAVYSIWIYAYPTSVIGFDPGKNIVNSIRILETGGTSHIERSFYQTANAYSVLVSQFVAVTGIAARQSLVIFPILFGSVILLSMYALLERMSTTDSEAVVKILTILVLSLVVITKHSFWPIPQSLGTLLLFIAVMLLTSLKDARVRFLLIPILVIMIYTHKLPLAIFFFILFIYRAITISKRFINSRELPRIRATDYLLAFSFVLLCFQFTILTEFFAMLVARGVRLLGGETTRIKYADPITQATHATRQLTGFVGIIYQYGHAIALLTISGLAWLYTVLQRPKTMMKQYIVFATAILVALTITSYIFSLIGVPYRYLMFVGPFCVLLISIAMDEAEISEPKHKHVLSVILIIIIFAQITAPAAVPDSPDTPRDYLDSKEISAREFNHDYITKTVYTDTFMALKPTINPEKTGTKSEYNIYDERLVNGSLPNNFQYVTIRSHVNVFGLATSTWRLHWDPTTMASMKSSKVYTNGGVHTFQN